LLRTGEREAYRQFFLDAMLVVEGTLCTALFCTLFSETKKYKFNII